jgi:glycosyltransferase involved in cell wall biosynthesis
VRLTVTVITKNESAHIAAALKSVAWADETIVVDSGSTDDTVAIARAHATRVEVHDWPGYGPQKEHAAALASNDWILSLDADERVTPELGAQIQAAMAAAKADAYELPRLTRFCGRWIRHCGWTPDYVLRLFRRGRAHFSEDLVHERVITELGVRPQRLTSPLLHESYPTPAHYWRKLESYSHAWARQNHALGRRTSMLRAATAGVVAFLRSYLLRLGFLDGAMGFAVCTMQAQAAFGKYFALYCLNRQDDPNRSEPSA